MSRCWSSRGCRSRPRTQTRWSPSATNRKKQRPEGSSERAQARPVGRPASILARKSDECPLFRSEKDEFLLLRSGENERTFLRTPSSNRGRGAMTICIPNPAFIQAKEQKQWDKELAKLRAVIPADSYVDIFSKDWGPIENVKVVNIIEFMGRPYFHLVSRKGW